MTFQWLEIFQQVKANIEQAQDKQKEYYNHKHANPAANKVGAKVLKDSARIIKEARWTLDLLGSIQCWQQSVCPPFSEMLQWLLNSYANEAHLKPYHATPSPLQSPASSFASNPQAATTRPITAES